MTAVRNGRIISPDELLLLLLLLQFVVRCVLGTMAEGKRKGLLQLLFYVGHLNR